MQGEHEQLDLILRNSWNENKFVPVGLKGQNHSSFIHLTNIY